MGILSTLFRSIDELIALGYPREVAARIASNKLDMRPEAVAERREALFPETFYSGSTSPDILENAPTNMAPQYLWASESPGLAASYAGRRLNRRPDEAPTIYPLAVNTEGFDRVLGGGATWNTLRNPTVLRGSERITMDDITSNTDELLGFAYESGVPGILFQDIVDPGPYQQLMRLGVPSASGGKASQREIDEFLQELERNPPLNMAVSDTTRTRAKYGAAFDPEYTGPNILGSAAGTAGALGLLAAPEDAEAGFVNRGGRTLLEAFHGSPYQFDRFDMSKIGTGEGAQAYGHGLYFADDENLAKAYRDTLKMQNDPREGINKIVNDVGLVAQGSQRVKNKKTGAIMTADPNNVLHQKILSGEIGSGDYEILSAPEGLADSVIAAMRDDPRLSEFADNEDIVNDVVTVIRGQEEGGTVSDSALSAYRRIDQKLPEPTGALYRTEIDVAPESLLDWDKPLKDQPNALRAFQEMYSDEMMRLDPEILGPLYSNPADVDMGVLGLFDKSKGSQAYNTIKDVNYVRGAPAMSEKLREKGIKGIKYLDGNSRGAGDGTSNYVIFDDSLINIADRYAIAPPMFAPSQDRALAAANKGLLDPLTVDEQRIQQHQRDINKQMAQIGLLADPMYEYGNIIPAKTNIVTGETSLAFPGIARDIIGGLLDLANTRRSGVYNPAALMDVAL